MHVILQFAIAGGRGLPLSVIVLGTFPIGMIWPMCIGTGRQTAGRAEGIGAPGQGLTSP